MGGGKHPLAFLGKKSWHTKNLKNVEKVWIAEEKEKAEQKKLADLQKQIIEERQMAELRQMQADAGIGKAVTEKLDWMYEGPMSGGAVDAQQADEYLMGKAYEPKAAVAEVNDQISRESSQPGALWANKKPSANNAFTLKTEDPLMKIKQQELRARELVVKNPLKMHKVKQEIESQLLRDKEARREQKRERKDAKKARKREKKEKKDSKKRMRLPSPPSTSSSADEQKRDSGGDRSNRREERPLESQEERRYGLQNKTSSRVYAENELGPSAEQRQRKRESEDTNKFVPAKRARPAALSEEEKAARLAAMQSDARAHDQRRSDAVRRDRSDKKREETAAREAAGKRGDGASFLKAMERDVYTSGNIDMEERVKRNRQNHQRDLGSDSFMRK